MSKPRVVILGAGPAGLGAAFRLVRGKLAHVTVLERNRWVGGNAGSFELSGLRLDYGSHRLHPACDPEVLKDIRGLLGEDLLDRPRHGRIRLQDRWIHFPLQPLDVVRRLPASFAVGVARDTLVRVFGRISTQPQEETFASVLETGLGKTICRDFYFPYARKLWGLEPEEISATQALRRVSASSIPKMVRKIVSAVPGLRTNGRGRFFYPRQGYGQISDAFHRAAQEGGAEICLEAQVDLVEIDGKALKRVYYSKNGHQKSVEANYVWSTIPVTNLARCLRPRPPQEYLRASERIDYRAMILVYLVLNQDRFSEYDAHYFPELDIPISRLSEPKNYGNGQGPPGLTALCAELPCNPEDPEWDMSDEALGQLVCEALTSAGIPVRAPIREVATRRLRNAYPIYRRGYEVHFNKLDRWLSQVDGLLSFGRQGLFAHDNTHHALYMAYCAASCLDERGSFDDDRWKQFRQLFESHVVED